MATLIDETSEIIGLYHQEWSIHVGQDSIAHIRVYHENGQMALVPWFAVYDKDMRILQRISAANITGVTYKT